MHKGILTSVLLLGAMLTASGCANNASGSDSTPSPTEVQSTTTATSTPEANQTMLVTSYYSDSNGEELLKKEVEITYKSEDEKYMAALETLKTVDDPNLFALAKGLTFHSAVLENGLLTIDLSVQEEGRLGSGGEMLLLDALYTTMFQFQEVESVDLLDNGVQTETLMGHVTLQHPYQKPNE